MSRPASTTSAPSDTSGGTSSPSGARRAAPPPSSGPPAVPPAASGTATPSTTGTGSSRSRRPFADVRAGLGLLAAELSALRALLPSAAADLSAAVRGWPEISDEELPGRPAGAPFDRVLSLFPYEGSVREAIREAKYGGRGRLAAALAARLFGAVRGRWADLFPDAFRPAIVPVPIRPLKYLWRGYNVPALIGSTLAGLTGWPFAPAVLRRDRETRPQAGLPLAERAANVRGAFSVPKRTRVPPSILLLDDVYTSGATAAACARALNSAGAQTIVVLTVACATL